MTVTSVLVRLQGSAIDAVTGGLNVLDIFESDRIYDDYDPELDLIASKPKRAQWRHRRIGPSYLKLGRRIKYCGSDLNAWLAKNRVELVNGPNSDSL